MEEKHFCFTTWKKWFRFSEGIDKMLICICYLCNNIYLSFAAILEGLYYIVWMYIIFTDIYGTDL